MLLMAGDVYLVAFAAIFLKPDTRVLGPQTTGGGADRARDLAFAHSRGID